MQEEKAPKIRTRKPKTIRTKRKRKDNKEEEEEEEEN